MGSMIPITYAQQFADAMEKYEAQTGKCPNRISVSREVYESIERHFEEFTAPDQGLARLTGLMIDVSDYLPSDIYYVHPVDDPGGAIERLRIEPRETSVVTE